MKYLKLNETTSLDRLNDAVMVKGLRSKKEDSWPI
jgi:hypothetical protein